MENKILKPKDLIKGYWYVGKSGVRWLFKFSHLNVRKVRYTVCGTPIDGWRSSTDGFLLGLTDIREATEKEVKKLFPHEIYTNKPMKQQKQEIEYYEVIKAFPGAKVGNKLKKVGDEWMLDIEDSSLFYTQKEVEDKIYFKPIYREKITFKKGNWYICIGNTNKSKLALGDHSYGWAKGLVFQATQIDDHLSYKIVFGAIGGCGVYSDQLREATAQEIVNAQQINIGHRNVEFPSKGKIKIGCSEYTVADVKACLKVLKLSRATYISFEGNIVNKEIIDKILSRMK